MELMNAGATFATHGFIASCALEDLANVCQFNNGLAVELYDIDEPVGLITFQ